MWRTGLRTYMRMNVVVVICLLALATAVGQLDWTAWVQNWIGTIFKACSGAVVGWAISRYGLQLDLSACREQDRPIAGLAQALIVASCALAVATGA